MYLSKYLCIVEECLASHVNELQVSRMCEDLFGERPLFFDLSGQRRWLLFNPPDGGL